MWRRWIRSVAVSGFVFGAFLSLAQEANPGAPTDADRAWLEVEAAMRPPFPPAEWKSGVPSMDEVQRFHFKTQREWAERSGELARSFYYRYPDHPMSENARLMHFGRLQFAATLGEFDHTERLRDIEHLLTNPDLTELEKFNLRWESVTRRVAGKLRVGSAAVTEEMEKGARALQQDFPNRPEIQQLLLMTAFGVDSIKAGRLGLELLNGPGTERIQKQAFGLLAKLVARVKPAEMEFTAIDGQTRSLGALRGKVVVLHFWVAPGQLDRAELAVLQKCYREYHPSKLEVIGMLFGPPPILDAEPVKRLGIPWPQVVHVPTREIPPWRAYGIKTLPAIWLFDKRGFLREYNVGADLSQKLATLLAEPAD